MVKRTVLAAFAAAMTLGSISWLAAQQRMGKMTADDYVEIQQLYSRYNDAIDSGDAEGYAATFIPDGTFNTFKGHDALVGFIHNWHEKMGGENRRHWNTNLTITPTADGASGTVYLMLIDVGTKPPSIVTAAKYDDELVKTPQGWRFKKRATKADGPPRPVAAEKK